MDKKSIIKTALITASIIAISNISLAEIVINEQNMTEGAKTFAEFMNTYVYKAIAAIGVGAGMYKGKDNPVLGGGVVLGTFITYFVARKFLGLQ